MNVASAGCEHELVGDYVVSDEHSTVELARRFGEGARPGSVFALHGGLGAGKTRFAQGIALALGVTEPVWSPTFTLVNEHAGRNHTLLIHMDLYRLGDEQSVEDLGFEELLERATITVIEWPERAGSLLPAHAVHVWLDPGEQENERRIRIAVCLVSEELTTFQRLRGF